MEGLTTPTKHTYIFLLGVNISNAVYPTIKLYLECRTMTEPNPNKCELLLWGIHI
jgi:hypothetical protein